MLKWSSFTNLSKLFLNAEPQQWQHIFKTQDKNSVHEPVERLCCTWVLRDDEDTELRAGFLVNTTFSSLVIPCFPNISRELCNKKGHECKEGEEPWTDARWNKHRMTKLKVGTDLNWTLLQRFLLFAFFKNITLIHLEVLDVSGGSLTESSQSNGSNVTVCFGDGCGSFISTGWASVCRKPPGTNTKNRTIIRWWHLKHYVCVARTRPRIDVGKLRPRCLIGDLLR